jgi:2-dehydro-3-deoxygalactonokinase
MTDGAALIGVDWGGSNLRVFRIAPGGDILAVREDGRGAAGRAREVFARTLREVAGDWLEGGLPVRICGMAGARGCWTEAPYAPAPATVGDLAASLVQPDPAPGLEAARLVPGVAVWREARLADVMRGEETQVMGLDLPPGRVRVVAPGTHGKWITAEDGRILDLRTYATGELFQAVRWGAVLGAGLGDPGVDPDAFAAGVRRALDEPALSAALFALRVEQLAGRLDPRGAADFLSGLLIGAEAGAERSDLQTPVTLVGAGPLVAAYGTALEIAGFQAVSTADGQAAAARGLWRIHQAEAA